MFYVPRAPSSKKTIVFIRLQPIKPLCLTIGRVFSVDFICLGLQTPPTIHVEARARPLSENRRTFENGKGVNWYKN